MSMNKNDVVSAIAVAVQGVSTALQTDEVFQYIQLGLTIISALVALIVNVVVGYKKITADGKVTEKELNGFLADTAKNVAETSEKVNNSVKEATKDATKGDQKKDN